MLRSALRRIIVYCGLKKSFQPLGEKVVSACLYKKVTPKEPSNFRPITLELVCAKVFTSLI